MIEWIVEHSWQIWLIGLVVSWPIFHVVYMYRYGSRFDAGAYVIHQILMPALWPALLALVAIGVVLIGPVFILYRTGDVLLHFINGRTEPSVAELSRQRERHPW